MPKTCRGPDLAALPEKVVTILALGANDDKVFPGLPRLLP
jgi:hypothetical protein